MIVAGLVGPPGPNCFQVRRRVKSPGADGDPVRSEPRLPEKRGAAFLAEGISRIRHRVEPPQVAIIILDLKISDIGGCRGHVMACEAPAPMAMAVEDVPEVSEDLEGDPTAKASPRCPRCRIHVLPPPCGRLRLDAPGQVTAPASRTSRSCRRHRRHNTGTFQPAPDPGPGQITWRILARLTRSWKWCHLMPPGHARGPGCWTVSAQNGSLMC